MKSSYVNFSPKLKRIKNKKAMHAVHFQNVITHIVLTSTVWIKKGFSTYILYSYLPAIPIKDKLSTMTTESAFFLFLLFCSQGQPFLRFKCAAPYITFPPVQVRKLPLSSQGTNSSILASEYKWREDMNFMFEKQELYRSCHDNMKFISSS